jgi:two-component system chemotaxis response regulator CheB
MIVYDGAVTLSRGPQENGHRPAVDVLFRSAARAKGPRTVGVVLSGALDDGAAGMVALEARGGMCLVQAFDEALYDSMPRAALTATEGAEALSVAALAARLTDLVLEQADRDAVPPSTLMKTETAMADLDPLAVHDPERPGKPSGFACPDCHGVLFEITEGSLLRYRCRVGHAWSGESLVARQTVDLESALWMALRSLEEKAALNHQMGARATARGHALTSHRFAESADETLKAAELVRDLIARIGAGERSTA